MNFDDIRPFNDDEVPAIVKSLLIDPTFVGILKKIYHKDEVVEQIKQLISNSKSIEEFQSKVVVPLLGVIEKQTTQGITFSAMDQFDPKLSHLIISNHRDIILDSAFLNLILHTNGFNKTEIAIGDNLLAFDWISKLVKLNRSFIVKRGLGIREQLLESKKLSSYIRHCVSEKGENAWIAQKEGRSKDGHDETQPALLKMLNMSNEKSQLDGFKDLNIVPMAISYEIEPCAISKVKELLTKKHDPDFKKSQKDDLNAMANGVMQAKGRVHFAFGNPVNIKIEELTANKSKNEVIKAIAEFIDRRIYFNYKLWPNNYIAYDFIKQTDKHADKYTEEEKDAFKTTMDKELATLNFTYEEASEQYLKMYANPVINFEKHFS